MKQEHKLNDKLANMAKSLQILSDKLKEIKSVEQTKVQCLEAELRRVEDNISKANNGSQSKPVQ